MKNVLFISELYYPVNVIGALRPTKLSQKLCDLGYKVDVFTKFVIPSNVFHYANLNIYGFDFFEFDNKKNKQISKKHSKVYSYFWEFYNFLRYLKDAKCFLKQFKKYLNDCEKIYDVVISSYGPISSLLCGLYFKKKFKKIKWICDFRDPLYDSNTPLYLFPYLHHLQNKACKNADIITTISKGLVDRIGQETFNKKIHLIYNGFDENEYKLLSPTFLDKKRFTLTYTGSLYGEMRDLTPVIKAIKELANENMIDLNRFRIAYAGNDIEPLTFALRNFDLENILEYEGYLDRKACMNLEFSSNVLLLATWNYKKEYGVITGKFLEYMLIKKPIISITKGDLPNSEVTQIIKLANLGCAYEEANHDIDFLNLKQFIYNKYINWLNNSEIGFEPNEEFIQSFNYKLISLKLAELIEKDEKK